MEVGIDLSEYYINVEWDILRVPAERHVKVYTCCPEPYPGEESVQCSIWVNVRDLEILCNTIAYLTCMHSPNNTHSLHAGVLKSRRIWKERANGVIQPEGGLNSVQ